MAAAAAAAAARREQGERSTRREAERGVAALDATSSARGMAGAPTGEAAGRQQEMGVAQTVPGTGAGAGVPAGAGAGAGAAVAVEAARRTSAANVAAAHAAGCHGGACMAEAAHGEDRSPTHTAEARASAAMRRAAVMQGCRDCRRRRRWQTARLARVVSNHPTSPCKAVRRCLKRCLCAGPCLHHAVRRNATCRGRVARSRPSKATAAAAAPQRARRSLCRPTFSRPAASCAPRAPPWRAWQRMRPRPRRFCSPSPAAHSDRPCRRLRAARDRQCRPPSKEAS